MANETKKIKTAQTNTDASPRLPKKRKKGKTTIVLLAILVVMGSVGFIFRKPIGQFLAKNFNSVPIIGTFFKEDTDPYSHVTKEQLIKDLEANKREQEQLSQNIKDIQGQNEQLIQRINTLSEYEAKYEEFLSQKEAWDEKIARTDTKLFLEQFEKMYPETMERIYKDIKIDTLITKEQRQFAATVAQMDSEQAARALEVLIPTDPELIKLVFEGMEQERKSLILSNMSSQNAAVVIKLLSPSITGANE